MADSGKIATKEMIDYYLSNKRSFYDVLIRKKKFLPSYESSIITIEFLHLVFTGQIAVPEYTEVHPIKLA